MSAGKRPARLRLSTQEVLRAIHADSESDNNKVSTPAACQPLTTRTPAPLVAGKISSRAPGNAFGELTRKVCAPQKVKRVFNAHDVIAAVLHGSDIDISGSDDDELDEEQHAEYEPSSSEEESDSPIGSITVRKGANFHQRLQRRTLIQRKVEFFGRKRIFTSQILHGCTAHPTRKL